TRSGPCAGCRSAGRGWCRHIFVAPMAAVTRCGSCAIWPRWAPPARVPGGSTWRNPRRSPTRWSGCSPMADVKVTERELEVLVKMLGMLGAATVGERAAAALKVSSWVKDRGLAWSDVILPPPPPPVTVRVRGEGDSWMNSMAQMAAQAQAREAAAQAM